MGKERQSNTKVVESLNLIPAEQAAWSRNDNAFKALEKQRNQLKKEMNRISREYLLFIGRASAKESVFVNSEIIKIPNPWEE